MRYDTHFIIGQTATGKTSYATDLCHKTGGSVINCDSRQIYKYLDIVTGKTDNPKDVDVYMVDFLLPSEFFSSYAFAKQAYAIIQSLHERGLPSVITGGTGMYALALYRHDKSRSLSSTVSDTKPRSLENTNVQDLQKKMSAQYPDVWNSLNQSDRKNKQRLARILERETIGYGKILAEGSATSFANMFHTNIIILLHKNNETLTKRIAERVQSRIKAGAIDECRTILSMGYSSQSPGLNTVGYKSIMLFLAGKMSLEDMTRHWTTKEVQYAKRQRTFFLKFFPNATVKYL
jgi:tRNA dimethylallyltransferase